MNHISIIKVGSCGSFAEAEVEGFPATGAGGDLPKAESPNLRNINILC